MRARRAERDRRRPVAGGHGTERILGHLVEDAADDAVSGAGSAVAIGKEPRGYAQALRHLGRFAPMQPLDQHHLGIEAEGEGLIESVGVGHIRGGDQPLDDDDIRFRHHGIASFHHLFHQQLIIAGTQELDRMLEREWLWRIQRRDHPHQRCRAFRPVIAHALLGDRLAECDWHTLAFEGPDEGQARGGQTCTVARWDDEKRVPHGQAS